jgi:hypothetical protein
MTVPPADPEEVPEVEDHSEVQLPSLRDSKSLEPLQGFGGSKKLHRVVVDAS